jgi:hypothetical protein
MRVLALCFASLAAACAGGRPQAAAAPARPTCTRLASPDSAWLTTAISTWHRTSEPLLRLTRQPLPPLILFDRHCVYRVTGDATWSIAARSAHTGMIALPNGRAIGVTGIGITSPTVRDTGIFLALALPDVWIADPRYRDLNDSRASWERYLVGAFVHEMTHARMLPALLPTLRRLEVAIFPDTLEDNAIQNRFRAVPAFAASVARETDLFYSAASATTRRSRIDLARAALFLMRERRARFYVGELEEWSELEQTFLDLEGAAQWAAYRSTTEWQSRTSPFNRALGRFRAGREFWSEDEGLAIMLALDAIVPDWQQLLFSPQPVSAVELLARAVDDR